MKSPSWVVCVLNFLGLTQGPSLAGDHFFKHHGGWVTTTTTTTSGSPVVLVPVTHQVVATTGTPVNALTSPSLAPAAVPFTYVPVPQVASPAVSYYYYTAQPGTNPSPVAPSAMTAPSLLAPLVAAQPVNVSGQAVAPFAQPTAPSTTEGNRTNRLLQQLRQFAASNNLDRNTLVTVLRNVGLSFLRAELTQYGLGGLVPSPTDNNVIEDAVNKVLGETQGQGGTVARSPEIGATGSGGMQLIFQGPVTLSFPGVTSVTTQGATPPPPAEVPANNPPINGNPSGDAVPPSPRVPSGNVPPPPGSN